MNNSFTIHFDRRSDIEIGVDDVNKPNSITFTSKNTDVLFAFTKTFLKEIEEIEEKLGREVWQESMERSHGINWREKINAK